MINDDWWTGVIESKLEKESPFLSIRVKWDTQELEYMSPWDLEPVDPSRAPEEVGGSVPVLPEEIEATLYQPSEEEWPNGGREESTRRILRGLEQVMGLSIAEIFLTPVDISLYPLYAYTIEYPIDLSLIKARFENNFYRRITAAQFDVRYLATNAEKFNESRSPIVKSARIVTELCLKIISSPDDVDVSEEYHRVLNGYHSSPSGSEEVDVEDDPDQPGPSRANRSKAQRKSVRQQALSIDPDDWRRQCIDLLELLWQQADAEPFREPVDIEEFPDYMQVVKTPMDLSTVRSKLLDGDHENPHEFAKDIRLIFTNSKNFNTNKHSRIYAMTCRLSSLFEDHMKKIIHDWKTAQIRSKASLLKGKKRVALTNNSGTDESDGDNTHPSSHASSRPGSSAVVAGGSQLKSMEERDAHDDDDDDDDNDDGDNDRDEEEEDINAPGPSSRVSKVNGLSNGHTSKRTVRASTRTVQPLQSDSGSDEEDEDNLPRPSRPVRSVGIKRKQYESDNSYDPAPKDTKRRKTAQKTASNPNSRASINDSDDSSVSAYKPSTRSMNGHPVGKGKTRVDGKGKGKGKITGRSQKRKKGNNSILEDEESDDEEDEVVHNKRPTHRGKKKVEDDSDTRSDSSSDSSSGDEEAEDTADSDESDDSVDLHAPPSKTKRATRSQRHSMGVDDSSNQDSESGSGSGSRSGSGSGSGSEGEEDNANAKKRNIDENSDANSDSDEDKENEDEDDDGSIQGNGRSRASRSRRKNYNESDSGDSDVSKRKVNKRKQVNRPVRNVVRNRYPMHDYASSDDDQMTSKSSSRRRKTSKPNYAEDESDEEPITTVSSRGRVRKVTEKARALYNKH